MIFLSAVLGGCLPSTDGSVDEQKDPHFITGRNRASSLDYKGAIDEFEKALETNPRSASAHFELGLLYGEQIRDYAAAIYHLQQHVKLRPDSEYTDRINGRIKTYKTELVKTEFVAPMNVSVQRDLERLTTENISLKRQVELLQAQLASRQVLSNNIVIPQNVGREPSPAPAPITPEPSVVNSPRNTQSGTGPAGASAPSRLKTYTVKSGDTVTSIAKDHRVKINSLLQANPGVDPRRLKVGQAINLPSS